MNDRNRLADLFDPFTIACRSGRKPGSDPISSASNARESSSESEQQICSVFTLMKDRRNSCHVLASISPSCHSSGIAFSSNSSPRSSTPASNGVCMIALQTCAAHSICQSNCLHLTWRTKHSSIGVDLVVMETTLCPNPTTNKCDLIFSVMLRKQDKCGNAKSICMNNVMLSRSRKGVSI